MNISSFDMLFYTSIFILPGFIVNSIVDLIVQPNKRHNDSVYFLKCLYYSLICCAIWSWLYLIVINCICLNIYIRFAILVLISSIGSTIIGVVIAVIIQHEFFERILNKFKIKTTHRIPTAWDYIFAKQESAFMIITLIDDKQLYGWYSTNSFTSSDNGERDIYI